MSENISTPKSARKRIFFSRSPNESSDSTLGHMSPLSSSPDRYSSPPPSPELYATPTRNLKLSSRHRQNKTDSPKSYKENRFSILAAAKLSLIKTPRKNENVIGTELIAESPLKDATNIGLMSPFKCLAGKEQTERTPIINTRKLIIGESPDISSLSAPVKIFNKDVSLEPATIVKSKYALEGFTKLNTFPTSSFYHSSRARASLFTEPVSLPHKSNSSIIDQKRKRSLSAESFHSTKHFSVSQPKTQTKRRKLGEINAGVRHRIRKLKIKKKKSPVYPTYKAQPKITPEDRIMSYIDNIDSSFTNLGTEFSTAAHNKDNTTVQQKTKNRSYKMQEREPSPPPDPTRKFFKTGRTLKIKQSATVTVDKNIKLKVSNGKFSLDKPEGNSKVPRNKTEKSLKPAQAVNTFEPIGEEKSSAETVQESVHQSVEMLLQKLESPEEENKNGAEIVQESEQDSIELMLQKLVESPEKNNETQENNLLSPNHHITVLASSTSTLAINDDPVSQPALNPTQNTFGVEQENSNSSNRGYLFEDPPDIRNHNEETEKSTKYFPLFYKNPKSKKLADISNMKSPRGVKRSWRSIGDDQYIIDAGQKKFGATECKDCGIVYQIGDPDDEIAHQKFHDGGHPLRYSVCKNERVCAYYGTDKVVLVKPSDSKPWHNRIKSVLKTVDKELGYADSGLWGQAYNQVYLYVTDRQIAGCVVVHPIQQAYKMLNSIIEGCDCCSEEAFPAKCGISRIWVAGPYRRRRIATKLLDSIRSCFIQGYVLGKDEIAFSAPTVTGKIFAEKYTGTANYLVYT